MGDAVELEGDGGDREAAQVGGQRGVGLHPQPVDVGPVDQLRGEGAVVVRADQHEGQVGPQPGDLSQQGVIEPARQGPVIADDGFPLVQDGQQVGGRGRAGLRFPCEMVVIHPVGAEQGVLPHGGHLAVQVPGGGGDHGRAAYQPGVVLAHLGVVAPEGLDLVHVIVDHPGRLESPLELAVPGEQVNRRALHAPEGLHRHAAEEEALLQGLKRRRAPVRFRLQVEDRRPGPRQGDGELLRALEELGVPVQAGREDDHRARGRQAPQDGLQLLPVGRGAAGARPPGGPAQGVQNEGGQQAAGEPGGAQLAQARVQPSGAAQPGGAASPGFRRVRLFWVCLWGHRIEGS